MAYVEDLILPPPLHDFELALIKGPPDHWLSIKGAGVVSADGLRINKSPLNIRFHDDNGMAYSPSLNAAVYEQAIDGYNISAKPTLSNEQLDLILSWVFKNWATAKNGQLVQLNEIL
jgi:hypothetical protein